jgi:hypothetical protein
MVDSRGDLDETLGEVVTLLLQRLPRVLGAREQVIAAVGGLHLSGARARTLADYIGRTPDVLKSTRSDGPQAWLTLVQVLAADFPGDVESARCVRCGRTGPMRRRMDGQRGCDNCYLRGLKKPCVRCGEVGQPIWRENGGTVCSRCANRDHSRDEACGGCGKTTRVAARTSSGPLCQTCAPRPRYTCTSCLRPDQKAHKITDAGPICPACYHRQKVAKCSRCEEISPYVRLRPETETLLCMSCWEPPLIPCTRCGDLKPIKHARGGTPVCPSCRARTRPRRECVECRRIRPVHSRLRMGNICTGCYSRLRNYPAACTACGETRSLIGRGRNGAAICGPCAGEERTWICAECGRFAALYADARCPQCVARERVNERLSNRTGHIHPQLQPLADVLDVEGNPRSVIMWLHASKWSRLLGDLANEYDKITHQILDDLPQTRHLIYLRQVLVHVGALDERDEDIEGTLPWVDELLEKQAPSVSRIVRPYATWSVLRRARRRSKVTENRSARKYARSRITLAVTFLNTLEGDGRTLQEATQTDIDLWLAYGGVGRHRLRDFILWAHARGLCAKLDVPWVQRAEPESFLGQTARWDLLRRCVHDDRIVLTQRVAGSLALLYGLTPTQIVQLTIADVEQRGEHTFLRLGRSPMVLPISVAAIVAELVGQAAIYRHSIVGSKPTRSPWLFPGGAPGHHTRASWISEQLNRDLGISLRRARNTALCALAEDLPGAVLADLLGLHITTATRWTNLVKRDWAQYVSERSIMPGPDLGTLIPLD